MKNYSTKYKNISASMTLAITSKAKQLIADGKDVISFGAGEPDFKTPQDIRSEAIYTINNRSIGYTAASGMGELKEAICSKFKEDNHLDYEPDNIIVSNGAKHSLFNAIQALVNPGDEIIIPQPYWVSYIELVKMAGGTPVILETSEDNGFEIDVEQLKNKITDNTKALLLNTPNNPTGAVYSEETLKQIADVCLAKDLFVISDEIYEVLNYESVHKSIVTIEPKLKDQTIVINGVSKAYAMTGWRIGYLACNKELATIIQNIQSHATSNPNTIAQYAAIAALNLEKEKVNEMVNIFRTRRNIMYELINDIKNISCKKPKGAFYIMMNISQLKGKTINGQTIEGSMDFANILLDEVNVAVVPGIAFGADDFVRLSYATSQENIEEGIKRIKNFLEN